MTSCPPTIFPTRVFCTGTRGVIAGFPHSKSPTGGGGGVVVGTVNKQCKANNIEI